MIHLTTVYKLAKSYFRRDRKDLNLSFIPQPTTIFQEQRTLKDTIYDLRNSAVKSIEKNYTNINAIVDNHEYIHGSFSSIYMSRNRVRVGMNNHLQFRRAADMRQFILML